MKRVLLIVTLDTKGAEAGFLKKALERGGVGVIVMDAGIFPPTDGGKGGDIGRQEVARAGGRPIEELIAAGQKGEAIGTMAAGAAALTKSLYDGGRIDGVLSIGGAQGTFIGTMAMRALPVGVPKLMVSTMASGKRVFEPYVGVADVTLMHSVVDFFGLNPLLKQVLSNAAGAMAGMVAAGRFRTRKGVTVAVTIYGTTTPAGMRVVCLLKEAGYDVVAFHPNGVGGMAMERMIREGRFDGVIDLTTHELIDRLAGGDHAAGDDRLEAASDAGIPQVVVPGGTDYIVTGRFSELKLRFRKRRTMPHNPDMTFVQPSDREMAALGRLMAHKLNRARGGTVVMVPLKGFSDPDREGKVFYNPSGVRAFVAALQKNIASSVPVRLLPMHVNDEPFAAAVVGEFRGLMKGRATNITPIDARKGDAYVQRENH